MTTRTISILLVEDDARDVKMTVRELQNSNSKPHIDIVRDGEEALDFLFRRGNHKHRPAGQAPQLVLLDLKLPKVDGVQVLREIKSNSQTRAIPVVVLTSSGEEQDMVICYKLGANSYIQKPVEFEQFCETIRALGIYWTNINEPPPEKAFLGPS